LNAASASAESSAQGDFQITLLLKPEDFTSLDAFGEC
jgi:hypothetical protein